jgi:hypothetical protein
LGLKPYSEKTTQKLITQQEKIKIMNNAGLYIGGLALAFAALNYMATKKVSSAFIGAANGAIFGVTTAAAIKIIKADKIEMS